MPTPESVDFPTALDTLISLVEAQNGAIGQLASLMGAGDTTFTLGAGQGALFSGSGVATIQNEIVAWGSKSGDVFSGVVRGLEQTLGGGAPASHAAGLDVKQEVTAGTHKVLVQAIIAVETKLGFGASTPSAGTVLKGQSGGQSLWQAITGSEVLAGLGFTPLDSAGGTMTGPLTVPQLTVTGDEEVDGNLDVEGNANVDGTLTVGGAATLQALAAAAVTLSGLLTTKGLKVPVRTVSADYTAGPDDFFIMADPSAGSITISLPAPGGANVGRVYIIKRAVTFVSGRHLGIVSVGGALVENVATFFHDYDYGSTVYISDGTKWWAVSRF